MRIFVLKWPKLPAAASVWAARKYIGGAKDAEIVLAFPDWDGKEMEGKDIALELDAGGRGWKGRVNSDGTVHSSFGSIVRKYAPKEDRVVLQDLLAYVNACETCDNPSPHITARQRAAAEETRESSSVLASAFDGLRTKFPGNEVKTLLGMGIIFDRLLVRAHQYRKAEDRLKRIQLIAGKVAVVPNYKPWVGRVLFQQEGIEAIVYAEGLNKGVIRRQGVTVRMDHRDIQKVVPREEIHEWYAHPEGLLYSRGTHKAPARTPSRANLIALAHAVAKLLSKDS